MSKLKTLFVEKHRDLYSLFSYKENGVSIDFNQLYDKKTFESIFGDILEDRDGQAEIEINVNVLSIIR